MKKFNAYYLILIFVIFKPDSLFAGPSADDILKTCQTTFQTSTFQTQHLTYRVSTVIVQGTQAPVTNLQTIELFKKRPGMLKMITDNGYSRQTIIAMNGYAYIQDPTSGKFMPVKGLAPQDPFQTAPFTFSNFTSATVNQTDNSTYEITVTGGGLPKIVDHAILRINTSTHTIDHVEGVDKNNNQVLMMDITYKTFGSTLQMNHFASESKSSNMLVDTTMDVLNDEINRNIDDSVFAVQ